MATVALPMETKVREFCGKLWLGMNLLERGHEVVLGPAWEVDATLHKTLPDHYISKDPSDSNNDQFDELREAGVRVYGLATEGGIGSSIDRWASNRTAVVGHLDGFLCWGRAQADALEAHYNTTDTIYITGDPRFDLKYGRFRSVYEHQAESIHNEYGPFVLVNTNFGYANPFDRDLQFETVERIFGGVDEETIRHDCRTFYGFLEGILQLSRNLDDLSIVVRPHPGEDHRRYEREFGLFDDIHVEHHGDVRGWIAAAEAVVHHDCTTGIESALLGTPVISYRPVDSPGDPSKVSQAVSIEAFGSEELLEAAHQAISVDEYELSSEQKERLRPYFENVDSCAATAICNVFEEQGVIAEKDYSRLEPTAWESIEARVKASPFEDQAARTYDLIRRLRGEESLDRAREKAHQKFPGLEASEIQEIVRLMAENDDHSVKIDKVPITNDTYTLQPRQ